MTNLRGHRSKCVEVIAPSRGEPDHSDLGRPVTIYSLSRQLGQYSATNPIGLTMSRPRRRDDPPAPFLNIRTTLVLLLALLSGLSVTALTMLADRPPAEAILAGLAATAAGIKFFHGLIA